MKRDVERLARGRYDLLVVGGGIYGACIARDAALRGLSVALLEKEDFGHATSANSLKIMHGGLRYLQDGRPQLMRLMTHERKAWMRIAPHLVHPLPCVMPTTRKLSRSRAIMSLGVKINDLLAYDRNRDMALAKHLPNGRVVGREEVLRRLPGVPSDDITGAILWYDAQVTNTERLLLSIVVSAAAAGAQPANYVEVTGFLRQGQQIMGVRAVDSVTGCELEIRADLVVVCAGAWAGTLLEQLGRTTIAALARPSLALNLITRQLLSEHAVALPTRHANGSTPGPRTLLIVPWDRYSLIGTLHMPLQAPYDLSSPVTEEMITGFLTLINTAYPPAKLTLADVHQVQFGFLPAYGDGHPQDEVQLLRESQILDYDRIQGITGLVAVNGVKYTTARHTAQEVVDLALRKLNRQARPCLTDVLPVAGGEVGDFAELRADAEKNRPANMGVGVIRHLVANYGAGYREIAALVEENPEWARPIDRTKPVIPAEIVHAVRDEMAIRLSDVVQRRTVLGAGSMPDLSTLQACADIIGNLLGWTTQERQQEIDRLIGTPTWSKPEFTPVGVA